MSGLLEDAGTSLQNIVKMNVYITSMDNFQALNIAYLKFFTEGYIPVGLGMVQYLYKWLISGRLVLALRSRVYQWERTLRLSAQLICRAI